MGKKIEENRELLEKHRAIALEMGLSAEERESLERIIIDTEPDQFDAYNVSEDNLKEQLEGYLAQIGKNAPEDISRIANAISRLSKSMQEGFEAESTWTMVRVSQPNDYFETPRWHPDGKYFDSEDKQYKLVATLKGPQTLFGEAMDPEKVGSLQKEQVENYKNNKVGGLKFREEDLRIRRELANVIEPRIIGKPGEAVIYLVGEEDAVLHSEPNIIEPRLFMAVLPGTKEQINQWQGRSS